MLSHDLHYAVRSLMKRPAFTSIAVLTLALGIGANAAIFSVVDAVLLKPLPFSDPNRIVTIWSHNTRQDVFFNSVSPNDFWDFRDQARSFGQIAAVSPQWTFTATGAGEAEQVFGQWVSASLFPLLGIEPQIGRPFVAAEDRSGGAPVVVLSHSLWQRRFGADPGVVGKTMTLGGVITTVIGVMPPGFRILDTAELWVPVEQNAFQARGRSLRYLNILARLEPGVSTAQAEAELDGIASNLEKQYPDSNTGFTTNVVPLHEHVVGRLRTTLVVLLCAVGFVLLIACANVANLLLVRAADRHREVAVRTALGASRGALIRQFLSESVLLALAGGAAGLIIAFWSMQSIPALAPNIPRIAEARIDTSVLAFTFVVSLLTGVLFGTFPALRVSRADLHEVLKEGGRGAGGGSGSRLRNALVVSEVAVAVMLLAGSGLLIRSFVELIQVDPGYDTTNIVAVSTQVPSTKYPAPADRLALYLRIEDKLKTIPDVASVGAVSRLPLSGAMGSNNVTSTFTGEDPILPPGERPEIDYRIASTDYFRTMGIPLIRGRHFTREDGSTVAVVNETAARRFWPGEEALGKRINFGAEVAQSPWVTIIGIVGDLRHLSLDQPPRPEVYRPYPHNPMTGPVLVVRTGSDPSGFIAEIRRSLRAIESDLPVTFNTMEELVTMSVAQKRFAMLLLGLFAGVAVALAATGLYGVISYSVACRTREMGLRAALGAQVGHLRKMVVGEGLTLALVGIAIGLAGAFVLTRLMSTMLFGVTPADPLTYLGVSIVLLGVSLVASYLPARRATRVDPMAALRYE